MIIGGGMSFTFVKAQGGKIGNSLCEDDQLQLALDIMEKAKAKGVKIYISEDVIAGDAFDNNANEQTCDVDAIPDGWLGMDAGAKALETWKKVIMNSRTILWNGPVGVFEMPKFAKGTLALVEFVAKATQQGAFSLVGGGDSVAAVTQMGYADKVSYVSTGGGPCWNIWKALNFLALKQSVNRSVFVVKVKRPVIRGVSFYYTVIISFSLTDRISSTFLE
jgi:phosphoglycerate kinase